MMISVYNERLSWSIISRHVEAHLGCSTFKNYTFENVFEQKYQTNDPQHGITYLLKCTLKEFSN